MKCCWNRVIDSQGNILSRKVRLTQFRYDRQDRLQLRQQLDRARIIFDDEIVSWKLKWQQLASEKPSTLQKTLCLTTKELHRPNATAILPSFYWLMMPLSIATQERSFSCMRRGSRRTCNLLCKQRRSVKSRFYLLTGTQALTSIDTDKVVREFCARKSRKLAFEIWTLVHKFKNATVTRLFLCVNDII